MTSSMSPRDVIEPELLDCLHDRVADVPGVEVAADDAGWRCRRRRKRRVSCARSSVERAREACTCRLMSALSNSSGLSSGL